MDTALSIREIDESAPADASLLAEAKAVGDLAFQTVRSIYRPRPGGKPSTPEAFVRLVVIESARIVGTVRYRTADGRVHLVGLAVPPDRRRRGIARTMIERLADIARQRGLRALSLYTIEQTGNVEVFERMGFGVIKILPAELVESPTGQPLAEAYMERLA